MRQSFWTVQRKMLIPVGVAVLLMTLAVLITWLVAQSAAQRLRDVEQKQFPVLRFYQNMVDRLKEVHLTLLVVGESEDFGRVMEIDDVHDMVAGLIETDGTKAIGEAESAKVLADFEKYYGEARALATRRVQAQLKVKRALAAAKSNLVIHTDSTPEEREIASEISAVENAYIQLSERFEKQVDSAQAAMTAGMNTASREQTGSIRWAAAILFFSLLLSGFIAWGVAARASRPLRNLSEAALRIAEGDLTQQIRVETHDEVGVLAGSFQRMVERLRELVGTLKNAANELAIAAEQLSEHTRAQSAMLERQASGVAETSSTTRELEQTSSVAASRASSVLEVARHALEMSEAGREAAEKSAGELQRIQASVESIVGQSSHLLEQARQVGDIVETVRDLATQSHVLSLNASIEAVKAGEAGKSFAVVAQEVRALAEQSGQGAASIGKIVEDILSAVQSTRDTTERGSQGMVGSLGQIRASGDSLREIGGIVRETSDAALQIASAVQQQSTGIGQIAAAMRDLDRGMEETVGRIRALELSSQQIAETATRISGIAGEFTV
jgi:methyl-accepting chemotaxis protein